MFHFCLPLQEADEGRLFLYYYECILSHRPIPPSTPQYNCGSRTNHNSTYFVNNGYPSSFNTIGQCSTTIEKVRSAYFYLNCLNFFFKCADEPECVSAEARL